MKINKLIQMKYLFEVIICNITYLLLYLNLKPKSFKVEKKVISGVKIFKKHYF